MPDLRVVSFLIGHVLQRQHNHETVHPALFLADSGPCAHGERSFCNFQIMNLEINLVKFEKKIIIIIIVITKVLIGDNLGCHFSPEVIKANKGNNKTFITLPPNCTHLCQPLDVSVFCGLGKTF